MKRALVSTLLLMLFTCPAFAQADNANDTEAFPIGHGHGPAYVDVLDKVLSRTIKAARFKKYGTHELERAKLYCSDKRAVEIFALLTGIEKKLSNSFPACLSNATHPRATLFVVTDDARAFKAFFRTLMRSYDQQWPGYAEGVDLQENTEFWIMSNAVVINGAAFADAESLLPVLAFGWGYMTISQTSDFACPEALATGFGNALEARVTGRPSVTLLPDSGEQEDDKQIDDWSQFMATELANDELDSFATVFDWTVTDMQHRDYAVSWSLVEDLLKDPLMLYAMLKQSSTETDTPATDLLTQAYSTDLESMRKRWVESIKNQ